MATKTELVIDCCVLLQTCKAIAGLIGNIDHSKGHGENAARTRGEMLNDIRQLCQEVFVTVKHD